MKVSVVLLCFAISAVCGSTWNDGTIEDFKNIVNVKKHLKYGVQGGHKIPITKSPYTVALLADGEYWGVGVLLNKNWVLTAGINTYVSPDEMTVRVGSADALSGGKLINVKEIIAQPQYSGNWSCDVGLYKLATPVSFSSSVKAIGLASSLPKSGAPTVLSGFGPTTYTFQADGILRQATIPFIPYKSCKKAYDQVPGSSLTKYSFCASKEGVGACPSEWGSPLVYKNKLVGVFSGSYFDCGSTKGPGVYADLTQFGKWIKNTIHN